MMMHNPASFYTKRIQDLSLEHSKLRKTQRWLGVLRLVFFAGIFPALFVLTPAHALWGVALTLVLLVVFFFLVKLYQKQNRKLQHLQEELKINKLELKALEYDYTAFDTGEEFIDTEHAYSYDMDLFGPGSIFQFITRTVTFRGKQVLAKLLVNETLDKKVIVKRQEAAKELSVNPGVCHEFRATGQLEPDTENDLASLSAWLSSSPYYSKRKPYVVLINLLPYLTTSIVVLSVFYAPVRTPALLLFLLQLAIVGRRMKHSGAQHSAITKQNKVLAKYRALLRVIEKKEYTSIYLAEVRNTLLEGPHSASQAIRQLTKIVSVFDNRLNLLMGVFLQGLFLWDLQCVLRLERWKQTHSHYFDGWIHALAKYDAMVSLANLSFNFPSLSYPIFSETTIIKAKDLGHVLLQPGECVTNNFEIGNAGDFNIITGANMAGKSTFLRSVATNMILAMAGAPVCAQSFTFKPMPLFSSMRTSDSLNKHESYFYAELKRLKELLDRLRSGEQLFIILDEILKGTNSIDKQKGSMAALKQIIELKGTGIIATHDLELAKIESNYPDKVCNQCFEIEIDRAKITFDYKLRPGVTTKMNALLLMEQMGVIQDKR